ncbi:MAG: cytochrome b/b6 domain-containing protein [Stenotrophomonas sp.]
MRQDTPERYGTLSRLLHWGMALLVVWQGLKFFDRIDEGEHWVGQNLVPWHISVGTLLLLLIVLRILWTLRNRRRRA